MARSLAVLAADSRERYAGADLQRCRREIEILGDRPTCPWASADMTKTQTRRRWGGLHTARARVV